MVWVGGWMNERKRKRSQAWEKRAAVGTRSCLGDWPGTYTRKPMALVTARVTSEANRSCHSFPAKLAYPALGRLRPPLAPGSESLRDGDGLSQPFAPPSRWPSGEPLASAAQRELKPSLAASIQHLTPAKASSKLTAGLSIAGTLRV